MDHERLKAEILNDLASFGSQIKDKNIVIFLGNTRSGKSTLVNYLLGIPLEAFENDFGDFKIEKVVQDGIDVVYGPSIGQGALSNTAIPGIYQTIWDEFYVDAPGFGDNRGPAQEIINAIFVHQISLAGACKFVLVTDIKTINNDNPNELKKLIRKLYELLPTVRLYGSISLIVTKAEEKWTPTKIGRLLDTQLLKSGIDMNKKDKDLVEYFATHEEVIGLFLKPKREGEIRRKFDVNVEDAINHNVPLVLMDTVSIRFAISNEARLALREVCQHLVEHLPFVNELHIKIINYENYFLVDDYVIASTDEELSEVQNFMKIWKNALITNVLESECYNINEILNSLTDLIEPHPPSRDVSETVALFLTLENIQPMSQTVKDSLRQNYKNALNIMIEKMNRILKKIEVEQKTRTTLHIVIAGAGVATTGGFLATVGAIGIGGAFEAMVGVIGGTASGVAVTAGMIAGPIALGVVGGGGLTSLIFAIRHRKQQIERRRIARLEQGR